MMQAGKKVTKRCAKINTKTYKHKRVAAAGIGLKQNEMMG